MTQEPYVVMMPCPACDVAIPFAAPAYPGESVACPRCRKYLEFEWRTEPRLFWTTPVGISLLVVGSIAAAAAGIWLSR